MMLLLQQMQQRSIRSNVYVYTTLMTKIARAASLPVHDVSPDAAAAAAHAAA
jgi:hypothetical protein